MPVNGDWIIRIRDEVPGAVGALESIGFNLTWVEMLPQPFPPYTPPPGPQPTVNETPIKPPGTMKPLGSAELTH